MFINSIQNYNVSKTQKQSMKISKSNLNYLQGVNKTDSVSFSGKNDDFQKNQLKILLTQDIWATNLKVKKPETELEKEVVLEILENREKLDRYVRLKNERGKLVNLINYAQTLIKTEPENPKLPELLEEIDKKGNIDKTIQTIDKNIKLEANKNKEALAYFENIEKIEDEYNERHIISNGKFMKFWQQIVKNNINEDGELNTKELIKIIKETPSTEETQKINKSLASNKTHLLIKIEKEYEQTLREIVNVYDGQHNHGKEALIARRAVQESNKEEMKKYTGIENLLPKVFKNVENKFSRKTMRMLGNELYPIGGIMKDIQETESIIKCLRQGIAIGEKELTEDPNNKELQDFVNLQRKSLEDRKQEWTRQINSCVQYESANRLISLHAKRLDEYDYLTSECLELNKIKKAYNIYTQNNETIPDEYIDTLIK